MPSWSQSLNIYKLNFFHTGKEGHPPWRWCLCCWVVAHRDVGIIMSSDLSWREHMKIFYPEHIKLSTLFDIHLACTVHQEDSLFVPSSFTAYILFTDLASPPSERHHNSWKDPALCDQIHPKRLQFWLQISSNCSQDSTLDDATGTLWCHVLH